MSLAGRRAGGGQSVDISTALSGDLEDILQLFRKELGREPSPALVESCIKESFAFTARATKNQVLLGFAYARVFAPDMLELVNILLAATARNFGIGSALLRRVENAALEHGLCGLVLVNSRLYGSTTEKRSAATFYLRNGYRQVFSTGMSDVFAKTLRG